MLRMLFTIALVCIVTVTLWAQAPVLERTANGQPLGPMPLSINQTHRVTLKVADGMPWNQGYVYEFGPVQAYRMVNGQRQFIKQFRPSEVMNSPVLIFSIGPQRNPDLTGSIELELEWVKRYNPNNSVETLPLSAAERTMAFTLQP